MGIRLVVEVLDHYHGPDHKFRWLIAFAESAKDRTRTGWPSREQMARRIGKSPARVSNIGSELVADGVLQRCGGGGRHRGNARYTLLPLAAQSSPTTNPETVPQGSPSPNSKHEVQGSPATNFQGSPATNFQGSRPIPQPAETVLPNPSVQPSVQPSPSAGAEANTQTILREFIDWDRTNGGELTSRVKGQLAKEIATLLAQGIDDRHIRTGLANWRAKDMHPATLDSFVSAAMNGHRHRPSTGDRAIAEAAALKAQLRNHQELA